MHKHLILSFSDSNMAGYNWRWEFYVQRHAKAWRLSARQVVCEDMPMVVEPRSGLTDGAEIFDALRYMLQETGYDLDPDRVPDIAAAIEKMDPVLADEFRRGEEIIEEREAVEEERVAKERVAKLAPYRERIDRYVERFSDDPRKGWASARTCARVFIENYVVEHGRVPAGRHVIEWRGYSGPAHDFGDFA